MTFGEKMRSLLAERGVSLRGLARMIPANPGHLSKISRDLRAPSRDMAERIDAALDAGGQLAAIRPPGVREMLNGRFTPDDEDRLHLAVQRPSRIDPKVVDSLAVILAEQRRLEDSMGSAPVLHAVTAQLQTITGLVADARGAIRPQLVGVAAQWAQFSGWLNIATGDVSAARASLDRAAEHAEEVGDEDMVGTVLSWRAYLAEQVGQLGTMIGMAHAAQNRRVGPGQVYDMFLEARGHALTGEREAALRGIGAAQDALADVDPDRARPWEYYYLEPGFFTLEAGLTRVYIGRADPVENVRAVEDLSAGLAALPEGMRRSEWAGVYISLEALGHVQARDAEAARARVLEAAEIAHATSSGALLGRLHGVQERMRAEWPDDSGIVELREALR